MMLRTLNVTAHKVTFVLSALIIVLAMRPTIAAGPTVADVGYASADRSDGRRLDLFVPQAHSDPVTYISAADPPLMIFHGQSDLRVPHNQGERLYQALAHACHDAVFISLPYAGHGPVSDFLTNDRVRADATIRTSISKGCAMTGPEPVVPTLDLVVKFLETNLKR